MKVLEVRKSSENPDVMVLKLLKPNGLVENKQISSSYRGFQVALPRNVPALTQEFMIDLRSTPNVLDFEASISCLQTKSKKNDLALSQIEEPKETNEVILVEKYIDLDSSEVRSVNFGP